MRKKKKQEREEKWKGMSEVLLQMTGMSERLAEHPNATLEEIEEALDERVLTLRAQMLEDAVITGSQQENRKEAPKEKRPRCESCGTA